MLSVYSYRSATEGSVRKMVVQIRASSMFSNGLDGCCRRKLPGNYLHSSPIACTFEKTGTRLHHPGVPVSHPTGPFFANKLRCPFTVHDNTSKNAPCEKVSWSFEHDPDVSREALRQHSGGNSFDTFDNAFPLESALL